MLNSRGNLYLVAVDWRSKDGSKRGTGEVLVSAFTDGDKHSYWKVEGIDESNRHLLDLLGPESTDGE